MGWGAHRRRLWLVGFGNGRREYYPVMVCGKRMVRLRFGVKQTPCWVLKEQAPNVSGCVFWMVAYTVAQNRFFWVRLCMWWCGWLFVENCTVDASIFVVKLLRADGGCLGTRSR